MLSYCRLGQSSHNVSFIYHMLDVLFSSNSVFRDFLHSIEHSSLIMLDKSHLAECTLA